MKLRWILAIGACVMGVPAEGRQPGVLESLGVSKFDVCSLKLPHAGGWAPFEVNVSLGGVDRVLEFTPHSIRGPHFQVWAQGDDGALFPVPAGPEVTYRGGVRGEEGEVVAASLTERGLTALVRLANGAGTWTVQPMSDVLPGSPPSAHIVVSEADAVAGPWTCGVTDRPGPVAFGVPRRGGGTTDAFLTCQISCDADYEYFVLNGSNLTTTTNDISSVINGMAAIYQADTNVTFQIGTVIVRQSASQPYSSSAANTLLSQFQTTWNSTQTGTVRDIAHLFTGRDLDGSTIGLAYLGVVCNTTVAYGLSQSRFSTNFASRVGVTSHEVGHNFNEGHCDSSCSPCRIMCSGIGGCSGVVTSLGCSNTGIAAYAAGRACLTPFNNGITPPFQDSFASTTLDYNRWPTPANSGGVVNTNAANERSAPNSLNLSNTASITTAGIDLTNVGSRRVFVSFWTQHLNVENAENLAVTYRRNVQGDYQPLLTVTSNGVNPSLFTLRQAVLPVDGHGANATIRFTAQGNQADDAWYIDEVKVSLYCRADLNEDWALNILDFQAYQAGLSTLNIQICDWNGDGFITVLDYSAFFNAIAAGCTGY